MLMPLLITCPPATCPRAHDPESGRVESRPELDGTSAHAALAHQNDFDVCWARGSVSELLFAPLVSHLHPADSALQNKQGIGISQEINTSSTEQHWSLATGLLDCSRLGAAVLALVAMPVTACAFVMEEHC